MTKTERRVQSALGTLKIYEIRGLHYDNARVHYLEKYISERWIKASSAAEAIILTLKETPALADNYFIFAEERTQEDADRWDVLGPYDETYYRGKKK